MSFRFLNFPTYAVIFTFMSIYLFHISYKRRNIDRKILISIYLTIAPIGILAVLYRATNEVFTQFKLYGNYVLYGIFGLLIAIFLQFVYAGITHVRDERSKKLLRIALYIILLGALPAIILLMLEWLGLF
jgi:L-cystine uptake protein TcyP (sodium:dicarboxylate symporter family)